ncbi:hypothetical protein DPQ33_06785 [Oceanidesulfovibrio indonesiensis]|uniref:Glycosyltransferase subfamily 4-like N-terminal domain-containing protein n=1 Tax=Oceanidesulfovibrio indonesiensis TaxID=54767 RepID=A0A7M3MGJ9_9BACT|nr:glycosyltransferase [Oceanidesulfovibrio indonesiensis]TVM18444.1 hypothetical protein DPQ33_06785 [Oceanidesulfovibrio indonesiensis]
MTNALDILFLHENPCVRAYKQAVSLKKMGHRVHLVCRELTFQPRMADVVSGIQQYTDLDHLAGLLRKGRWDVIHSHNEPNEITEIALLNVDHCPVVYDCHDYTGLRQKLHAAQARTERRCFEDSHTVIHVSQGMLETAAERYASRRTMVLPSFPSTAELDLSRRPKLPGNHVVYLGGLLDAGRRNFEYRNYLPFFVALIGHGVHVHAFPSSSTPEKMRSYLQLDAESELFHLHQKLPYESLLEVISMFQWGLTGFSFEGIDEPNRIRFLNNALPNKLFDYIVAGVCPVVVNCDTAGRYAEELGVGYHARDIEHLVEIVTREEPKAPLEDLSVVDMDAQVERLVVLYRELMEAYEPGLPSRPGADTLSRRDLERTESLLNMAEHYERTGNLAKSRRYRAQAMELLGETPASAQDADSNAVA